MTYLGIDPGVSGGLAIVSAAGGPVTYTPMPGTERDLLDLFAAQVPYAPSFAVMEKVSASPQMGVVSAFTFGRGYGALLMALTASGIPYDTVTPQKWQAALGCRTGGDKNISKRKAQQLFPSVKVTHAIADALLLAEYCRRLRS